MDPIDFDRETLRRACHSTADMLDRACSEAENAGGSFTFDVMAIMSVIQLDRLAREFSAMLILKGENDGVWSEGTLDQLRKSQGES